MKTLSAILKQDRFDKSDLVALLSVSNPEEIEMLRNAAESVLLSTCGNQVYFRGLIEFSNICSCDCYYCGIRRSNTAVKRYALDRAEVVASAVAGAELGYGSVVLQSGERRDNDFVEHVVELVSAIKRATRSTRLPQGVGITLCVGEQSRQTYERFFAAGCHRYLLRIETSSPALYSCIHPDAQRYEGRAQCLAGLKSIGFLVGTGVMIGLPGQTSEDLADDILFFKSRDIDMIGMGPYLVHSATPMAAIAPFGPDELLLLSLKMIAVTRLVLRDVNIAATTALQALKPEGREEGLRFGANVMMPQLTPTKVKRDYLLYNGKPCIDEESDQCAACCTRRVQSIGRKVAIDIWGDPLHGVRRRTQA